MEACAGGGLALPVSPQEAPVLKEQVVEELLQRLRAGETVLGLARAYDVDPKTIRAWRARGAYAPRQARPRGSCLDPHAEWLEARAKEVEYNAAVLTRELRARGFTGSAVLVRRFVRPLRAAAAPGAATVRYETAPGQQAQVDFGQQRVWIGASVVPAHLFVCTLGFSRRTYVHAFPHERLVAVLEGHELAFQHFGGVPADIVLDNARSVVLHHGRRAEGHAVVWHPTYADFAGYYGFRPWAHWPHRPQTKGKVESGVKYVKRNALAGKRFGSWAHLNAWLDEWTTTVADTRVHGTTHELPRERFTREAPYLTPLGARPCYSRERVQHRVVATDALVAIGGSRYSVPVRYVGATVTIRELLGGYELLHDGLVIARHPRLGRHHVRMEPAHYAGLVRAAPAPLASPPRLDPGYPAAGEVAVRDLAIYDAIVAGATEGAP